jgi:hypothetical protein
MGFFSNWNRHTTLKDIKKLGLGRLIGWRLEKKNKYLNLKIGNYKSSKDDAQDKD